MFYNFDDTKNLGLVLKLDKESIDSINIVSISQKTNKIIKFEGSDWIQIYFSNNFDYSQVSELTKLSLLEKGKVDFCWITEQISLISGIPVEFVILESSNKVVGSNYSLREAEDIIKAVNKAKVTLLDSSKADVVELPDGTKKHIVTFNFIKESVPDIFKFNEVAKEQALIEIYNASNSVGYAQFVSNKFRMIGLDVTRVGNASDFGEFKEYDVVIYVSDIGKFKSSYMLIKSFFVNKRIKVVSERFKNMVTTGDIVVILVSR